MTMPPRAILALTTLLLLGCGGAVKQPPATPDKAVTYVTEGLANNKPQVIWQALPASYQKDVNEIIRKSSEQMDPAVYNQGFGLLQKVVKILQTKKAFILKNPMLKEYQVDSTQLAQKWDAVVKIPEILANSDLAKLESLKNLDVENLLAQTGSALMIQVQALEKLFPSQNREAKLSTLGQAKASVVKQEGDTATVKVEVPGRPAEEEVLQKVEGKWIPKELAEGWKREVAGIKERLAKLGSAKDKQDNAKMLAQMKTFDGILDQLLATQNEEEFNAALQGMLGGIFMMMLSAGGQEGAPALGQ